MVAVGAASLLGLSYGPLLWEFAGNLWSRPYYQHFPYVLLAAAVLIYEQLKTAPAAFRARRPWLQATLLTTAWLLLVLAVVAMSPLLAAVSAILLSGGLLAAYCRHTGTRFPAAPWLLTWLIIPPPVGLDQRMLTRLQLISSDLASKALDLLGVGHLMEGNTLILPTKQLFVDEACSGIVSVISLSTCAAIYAVWHRRPLLHIALLMVAAVGWAVLLNVVRIVTIALAEAHAGVDLAEGVAHTLLGLGIFALNVMAVIALDWLLHAILSEINPSEAGDIHAATADSPLQSGRRLIALWNWLLDNQAEAPAATSQQPNGFSHLLCTTLSRAGVLAAVAFAAVGVGQLVLTRNAPPTSEAKQLPSDRIVAVLLEPGVMPGTIGKLRLENVRYEHREHDNLFAEHSVVWEYTGEEGQLYMVSCDFPYWHGWHELSVCYKGTGWQLLDRRLMKPTSDDASAAGLDAYVELDLAKDGEAAVVNFCGYYPGGENVTPPSFDLIDELLAPFLRRSPESGDRPSLQIQVLTQRSGRVSDDRRQTSRRLLELAGPRIQSALNKIL